MEEEKSIQDIDLDVRYIQSNEFYRIAKELFQFDRNKEETYSQQKKNCLLFNSFNFPDNLNSYFIRFEDAHLYFSFETKLLIYLEEFIRLNFPQKSYADYYQLIKDFYNKWIQVKFPEEKKYFASSVLNYYERDPNKNNILNTIITAIMLCFDPNVRNVPKGIYLLDKIPQLIEGFKLNETYKKELQCLIEIYSGFGQMVLLQFEEAKDRFSKALSINPNNITAIFYIAYCENKLMCYAATEKILSDIFEYDINRVNYAIEAINPQVYNYFLNNLHFKNIFLDDIFIDSVPALLKIIQIQNNEFKLNPKELVQLLEDLKKTELKNLDSDKIRKEIGQIEDILKLNIDSKNIVFIKTYPTIVKRIQMLGESIIEAIKVFCLKGLKDNLSPFDIEIQEKLNSINNFGVDLEEGKKQVRIKLEQSVKDEERESSYNIKLIDGKIENLSLESKYDPKSTFKNTMMYTVIVSFISSLLGGCAGYSDMYVKSSRELNFILSTIIVNGFKWGMITFFIGFLISLFSASVSIIERANKKQKLLARVKYLKNKSEIEKQRLKERFQAKEKLLVDSNSNKINDYKKRIEDLKQNKTILEAQLRSEAENKIAEETKPFKIIFEKIG